MVGGGGEGGNSIIDFLFLENSINSTNEVRLLKKNYFCYNNDDSKSKK
mgnify:CR=1 FL=1